MTAEQLEELLQRARCDNADWIEREQRIRARQLGLPDPAMYISWAAVVDRVLPWIP